MKHSFANKHTVLYFLICLIFIGKAAAQGETYTLADTAQARVLLNQATDLLKEKQFENALKSAEQALEIFSQALGADVAEVADTWEVIGIINSNYGKYPAALKSAENSLKIRELIFGDQHVAIASSLFRIGVAYNLQGNYSKSLEYSLKALAMRQGLLGEVHKDIAFSYNEIGAAFMYLGDYTQAMSYQKKALHIRLTLFGEENADVATSYMNIGVCHNYVGEYDSALKNLLKSLDIRYKLFSENNPDNAACLNNIGISYNSKGDYEKAITYFNKSVEIRTKALGPEHPLLRFAYGNLGICYSNEKETQQAIFYTEKALDIVVKTFGAESGAAVYQYINLAKIYHESLQPSKALEFAQKSVDIGIKSLGEKHYLVGLAKGNLGNILATAGRFEEAIQANKEAISILSGLLGENSPDVSSGYGAMAINLCSMGKFEPADSLLKSMLLQLGYDESDSFSKVKSMPLVQKALYKLAFVQQEWYQNSKNKEHLLSSRKNYQRAINALNFQSRTISPASKSALALEVAESCQGAITTNQLLHSITNSISYWQEAFDYAERAKAYSLYESMANLNALQIAGIPDTFMQLEYNLRTTIAYQEKQRSEKLTNGIAETDSLVQAINGQLFDLKRQHETLIKTFETQYPQYYKAKYSLETAHVADVQAQLTPQQTLLEYVVGDSSIFLFLIQHQHLEVFALPKDFPLEKTVDSLTRHGIYGYYALPTDKRSIPLQNSVNNYTSAATLLYQKLLQRVENQLTEEVIIIPDGVLGYVPFEALLTKAPGRVGNFKTYDYWLQKHRISYCYSATLLREMREKKHQVAPNSAPLVFAPFFNGDTTALLVRLDTSDLMASLSLRDALNPLEFSGEEAAAIAKLWQGKALYGSEASLAVFLEKAPQHRMLHLSTHGKADDRMGDYAYLALGDKDDPTAYQKLYARDLYNVQLNADLVVLSACETALGRLRRGEGITSLARAFAYAGAKSLVTSLWKVDDAATKTLMIDFHRIMKNGKAKDAALQQAKIQYLTKKSKGDGAEMHPFFWAGFIGIGDMRAIR